MNISFDAPDKISGRLVIDVTEADYREDVEKTLKDYRRKANVPGFRPGMTPMGLIRRQYGEAVKADALNKIVGREMQKYISENKIQVLGEPMPAEDVEKQDLAKDTEFHFAFDVAVAPEIDCQLGKGDTIDYYDIQVDDALVDHQIDMFARQNGEMQSVDTYTEGDSLRGMLTEQAEGGIVVEDASLLPSYIKVEEQKALFATAKVGDVITFCPRQAYPENDSEVAGLLRIDHDQVAAHTGDFTYEVKEVKHFMPHAVDQDLFDRVYGKGTVADEQAFRAKIVEGLSAQLATDSGYRFMQDVRAYCEQKAGEVTFADSLLKRIMLENNKDKGADFVEKNYAQSAKELAWSLMRDRLLAATGVKIEPDDVKEAAKEAARAQFAQYGMNNVPDEYISNYADEMMKKEESMRPMVERAIDRKLTTALKEVVTLGHKSISLDDFNKLMAE